MPSDHPATAPPPRIPAHAALQLAIELRGSMPMSAIAACLGRTEAVLQNALYRARRRGVSAPRLDQPPRRPDVDDAGVLRLLAAGATRAEVARVYGCGMTLVGKIARGRRLKGQPASGSCGHASAPACPRSS
jgi:alkylation response protein AidB-like acyl-CoA dehydrogenase